MTALILPAGSRSRRADLLGQLRDLYLAEGFLSFDLADLGDRLGCSVTTLSLVGSRKERVIEVVLRDYFRRAARLIEIEVASESDPRARVGVYLRSAARQLALASDSFYADLAGYEPANAMYAEHTHRAAQRIQDLVIADVVGGSQVPARFVGAAVSHVLVAVQRGAIEAATGMIDANAYRALADLLDHGLGASPALTRTSTSTQEPADDRHQHVSLVPDPEQQGGRVLRRDSGLLARGDLPR